VKGLQGGREYGSGVYAKEFDTGAYKQVLARASPDLCSAKKIVKCPMRRKQLQKSRFVGAAILYHELLYAKRNAKRCIHFNTA